MSALLRGPVLAGVGPVPGSGLPYLGHENSHVGAVINVVPLPGTSLVLAAGLVWVGFVLFSSRVTSDRPATLARDESFVQGAFRIR